YHPIMGIAALGNSVVQITCRDSDIGWSLDALGTDTSGAGRVRGLERALDQAIDDILWGDLLSPDEVSRPTSNVLDRLTAIAGDGAALNHAAHRSKTATIAEDAHSPLYRRKRAMELRRLLQAKRVFQRAADTAMGDPSEVTERLLQDQDGRRALATAL